MKHAIYSLLFAVALCLGVTACGDDDPATTSGTDASQLFAEKATYSGTMEYTITGTAAPLAQCENVQVTIVKNADAPQSVIVNVTGQGYATKKVTDPDTKVVSFVLPDPLPAPTAIAVEGPLNIAKANDGFRAVNSNGTAKSVVIVSNDNGSTIELNMSLNNKGKINTANGASNYCFKGARVQ